MDNKRKQYVVLKDCEISFPAGVEDVVYSYSKGDTLYLIPQKTRTINLLKDGFIEEVN